MRLVFIARAAGGDQVRHVVTAAALATDDVVDRQLRARLVGGATVDARPVVANEDREARHDGEGSRHAALASRSAALQAARRPAGRATSRTCDEASSTP